MVFHACRTASGTISPRVGWNTFLHMVRTVDGKVGLIVPVHFLERAAVELAGRHVAGHRHERHGVEKRVARARSAGWPSPGRRR